MEPKTLFLSILMLFSLVGWSQTNTALNNEQANISTLIVSSSEDNWTFYTAEDRLYIDLELLGGYATDLAILNETGEVVLSEELMEVPKNSIYELDLATLERGSYSLKVRTYQDIVQKSLEVE